jgi:hypothetical protein
MFSFVIPQSVWRLHDVSTIRGSNPGGSEIFRTPLDRPWGLPSLLYKGYTRSFPGVERARLGVNHPPPYSAKVKERVELCLYWSSGTSWHVIGQGFRTYIHCCPNYLHLLCPTNVYILWRISVYLHISDGVETVYELPLLPTNTASETFLHKWEKCEVLTGYIFRCGACLAVTGRIRDIGQNILQSYL